MNNIEFERLENDLVDLINYIVFMDMFVPEFTRKKTREYNNHIQSLINLASIYTDQNIQSIFSTIFTETHILYASYSNIVLHSTDCFKIGSQTYPIINLFNINEKPYLFINLIRISHLFEKIPFFPLDLPLHSSIGLGEMAGTFSIQERNLLEDLFYYYALTERFMQTYPPIIETLPEGSIADYNLRQEIELKLANILTYHRNCLQTGFLFIETFVNSIGYNYYLRNSNVLSNGEKRKLQGKKICVGKSNHFRFPSLKEKMIYCLEIIGKISNPRILLQQDPFRFFLKKLRKIRNESIHVNPAKNLIHRTIYEVRDSIERYVECYLDVAHKFWRLCYPMRPSPDYLLSLDKKRIMEFTLKRIELVGNL